MLASDWLQNKKMMSFSVRRCVSFHIHTHAHMDAREMRVEILVLCRKDENESTGAMNS